jgi:hypothetical protein
MGNRRGKVWGRSAAWLAAVALVLWAAPAMAQDQKAPKKKKSEAGADTPKKVYDTTGVAEFFSTSDPLEVTLTFNVKRVRGDKGDKPQWHPATLAYTPANGSAPVTLPIRVETRGIWRLHNCDFPPIFLNFTSKETKQTIFKGLDKPKLTSVCRDDNTYEQYVLQEYQLYRIYRLLSPYSHAARLLHVVYTDSASGKPTMTRYAFLTEELDAIAARQHGKVMKIKGATIDDLVASDAALAGVFEYLIGNTDFSIAGLHNAELLAKANTGDVIPIVYDFDFSGAVNTRYATPDPRLRIRMVRQRLYRGYCVPDSVYTPVFALFNAKKDSIYGLYSDKVGQLMDPKIVKETLEYFDEFYKTINNPGDAKNEIIKACIGRGG